MDDDTQAAGVGGLIAGFILSALIFGSLLGFSDTKWRKEAIEHGYAEHDAKTGEWKWIEPTKTKGE